MRSPDHPDLHRERPHPTNHVASLAEAASTVLTVGALLVAAVSVGLALTVLDIDGTAAFSTLVTGGSSAFGLWAAGVALRLGAAIARELRQQTDLQARASGLHEA